MLLILMTMEDPEDRDLFTRLYTEYVGLMTSCAKRILNDWAEAEDAVQDVFVRLMESPEQIRRIPEENRKAFLVICARNRALNILKKKKPVLELEAVETMEAAGYPEAEESDLLTLLKEEIAGLPAEQQEILGLHYYLGLPFDEIGALLNKKPATVQKMSARLKKTLKERLKGGMP